MKIAVLLQQIYEKLYAVYGECSCPLEHHSPYQLLVAVMLSAQCRDERVNVVTRKLFAIAPTPEAMSRMPVDDIEKIIHSCGLSVSKSRNILAASEKILSEFNGEVPRQMDALVSLPGIGRKSANVILGNCFQIPGFPVDTHVKRLLNRIGAAASDSPEKIEKIVNKNTKPEIWTNFSHLLISHGRAICHSGKPECGKCVLAHICLKHGVKQ